MGCRSCTAMIDSKNPHAAFDQMTADADHVSAAVATGQTVHQDGERAAWSPRGRAVVVQYDDISIGQFDGVLPRRIASVSSRKVSPEQRLPVSTSNQRSRTQVTLNNVTHEANLTGLLIFG